MADPSARAQASLDVGRLLEPCAYPHPVGPVRLIETHISWVLLTGRYAYKIKKPVSLGFLDFSTPELRHRACLDELRLNRRFAPLLYLEVVPITGSAESPRIGGAGPVIDHAVKMVEFPQSEQLDHLLEAGRLGTGDIDALAEWVAGMHAAAPVAPEGSPWGRPEAIRRPVRDTLRVLHESAPDEALRAAVAALSTWVCAQEDALTPLMERRRCEQRVREVHGDLHLANLVRLESGIAAFDCIEFSESLRWIDVISDLAFTTMDLRDRGRSDLAHRLLSRYLEQTGDYESLPLLRYYEIYRALVRAKVALIRRQACTTGSELAQQTRCAGSYLRLARSLCAARDPGVVLMHGLSGSGKSVLSSALIGVLPALRVRSDVERKRLHGLRSEQASGSPIAQGLYSTTGSERTYARLEQVVRAIVQAGEIAIVDAAFLRRADRSRFRMLAAELGAGFAIVSCQTAVAELERRLDARRHAGAGEVSEADRAVLQHQLGSAEALDETERSSAITVDTGAAVEVATLASALRLRLRAQGLRQVPHPADCQACRTSVAQSQAA